jgi:hypothetical protein
MVRINDFSPAEWNALSRLWQGRSCRNVPSDTLARLRIVGAIQQNNGVDKLSPRAERLVVERMARISRAIDRNC